MRILSMLIILVFCVLLASLTGAEPAAMDQQPVAVKIDVPELDRQDWEQRDLFDYLVRLTTDKADVHNLCYRSEWIGKSLQVEGVLWQNEIIHSGGSLALKKIYGEDYPSHEKYEGQLVRVKGVLQHGNGLSSRFGDIPPHFYIEPSEIIPIKKATAPFLLGRGEDKVKAPLSE